MLAARRAVVTVEEVVDSFEGAPSERVHPAALGRRRHRGRARRRVSVVRATATTRATTRSIVAWDEISRDRDAFPRLARRARHAIGARSIRRSRLGGSRDVELHRRRDDDGRGVARSSATTTCASSGIGLPSAACNLARLTHAPGITLIYESGTIGARPTVLPLSIGDGELCATALTTVSVPEFFRYWLQSGRITVGFLGARADRSLRQHQHDGRSAPMRRPTVRLPGRGRRAGDGGLLPADLHRDAALAARALVERLDFVTSIGHGDGRRRAGRGSGSRPQGPAKVITDLCIMEPDPDDAAS